MTTISQATANEFGCPNCGSDYIKTTSCIAGIGRSKCGECGAPFEIASDSLYDSVNTDGTPIIQNHPRTGIHKHDYIAPDLRPEQGEYWKPRGVGYDLSGYMKSKIAGERLLSLVKEILNNENPTSWLDYRKYEPDYIQFKFQKEEFDLEKLYAMTKDTAIITKEILQECTISI